MNKPEEKRGRLSPMLDRLTIIALGLTLGIGAKYLVRYWPAPKPPEKPPAVPSELESEIVPLPIE